MKYIAKQLMMTVLLLMTATTLWATGTVTVVKKLNGTTNSSAGTVEQLISNGTCTLTVTPADGNYITVANITAERVISGGSAQAPRRAGGEPGMDNNIAVTAVGSTADPSGVTRYSFAMPEDPYNVEVVADFQQRTDISAGSLTIDPVSYVYDGSEREPEVTLTMNGSTINASNYSLEYTNNINAGTATVTLTGLKTYTGTKTGTFTITKANITPTVSLEGWTYGETAKTPVLSGNTGNGGVVYTYKAAGSVEYSATVPTAAGTHTVKATIAATANYNGGEATNSFTITKATITPSVTLEGWTYGESAKTPVVTGNTGNGQVTYSYKADGATDFTSAVPTVAGTHTVKATIAATANYNGNEATATFTIAKADITPSVNLDGWTYGETPKSPVVTGNTGNGQVTYSYKAEGASEFTNAVPTVAGTHTVKATIAATANYNGGEATNTFTITKADITPSVNLDGWTYGESAKTPVVTGNTGNGQVTYSYKAAGATDFTSAVPTAAGTHTVKATIAATANYNGAEATNTFTIAKAAITPTVSLEGWSFGETAKTPVVTGNTGNGQVTYSYKAAGESDFTSAVPTVAGTHTVKATIAATANYNGGEATNSFTITKATITPSVTLEGWTYGESPKTPVVTGNTDNGQVTYTYKAAGATDFSSAVPTVAGTHTVKATIAATANYEGGEATNSFTITKATITPSVTLEGWTYGESPKTPVVTGNTDNGQVTYTYKAAGATDFTSAVPTVAGTHTVKATIAATANYNGGEATNSFTITKATITPSVTLEGWTYGESPKTPVVTGNTGNGEVTITYKAAGASNFTATVPTAAGTHTVKATIAATANYNGAEATNTFTITKADITPSVSLEGWTYGDAPKTPVVTGNIDNGEVTITYKAAGATDFTTDVPTAAGTHTIKAVIAATTNYQGAEVTNTFTISKATPVIDVAEKEVKMSINTNSVGERKENAVSLYLNNVLQDGTYNYQFVSSNDKVVVIEDNTWLKPVGVGEATITVTGPLNDANLEPVETNFSASVLMTYDLTVAGVPVTSENNADILNDGGTVQFDGKKLLKLTSAHVTGAITTTMDELTIFLSGGNYITASTAAISGNGGKLTFTTDGNSPGKLEMTTTEATTVVENISAVLFNQNLAILLGAINEKTMIVGTPVKPIVDESGETNTIEVGGEDNLDNVVIEEVLYTLGDDDHSTDETDNSLLLNNTMADEDIQAIIENYTPGTPEFAEHFSGITFMIPAGYGNVIVNAKTGEEGILNVKIGSQTPYAIKGIMELTEFTIPYACQEATYVYIYNASDVVLESRDHRAGKKTTVTVGLASVGVSASGIQVSNNDGDNIGSDLIYLSDADVEYDDENATLKAINSEVNSIYEESFVTFPFLKYIDLRNTNITGINVSREEGAFKGVSKNTFIYVPAGNTTDEANVIIGNICESVVLDANMEEDEAFGLSENFVAGSIEYDRIFSKDEVATIYLPFDIANEDRDEFGTFYTIEKMENGKLKVVEETNGIKAHTPYIFKAATDNTQLYNFNVTEIGMPDEAEARSAVENTPELVGCYETFYVETENDVFRLATDAGNTQFVRMNIDEEVKPFQAYLKADTTTDELTVTDKDITGINQLYDNNNNKMDSYYNLAGQRVVMPTEKGVYVRNGRKTVIR